MRQYIFLIFIVWIGLISGCEHDTSAYTMLPFGKWGSTYRYNHFIDTWVDVALKESLRHHIPPSITLSQAILESNAGSSRLAREANNFFGITCGRSKIHCITLASGRYRMYVEKKGSWEDHSHLLRKHRFRKLFRLEQTDYKAWANGLQTYGYATDRRYASKLIQLIEAYRLYLLDSEEVKKAYTRISR